MRAGKRFLRVAGVAREWRRKSLKRLESGMDMAQAVRPGVK